MPPAWDPAEEADATGDPSIPTCGIGDLIRNGMVRKDGSGRDFGVEPLMEEHAVDLYLCGRLRRGHFVTMPPHCLLYVKSL